MQRRQFLFFMGAGLCVSATGLPLLGGSARAADAVPEALHPYDALVELQADGTALLRIARQEIGQGTATGIAQVIADELRLPWERVRIAFEAFRPPRATWTGGSRVMQLEWAVVRPLGATLRTMITTAAAETLGVPAMAITLRDGRAHHAPSGRSLAYFDLLEAIRRQPIPTDAAPLPREQWNLIGTPARSPMLDDLLAGKGGYSIDVDVPGMKYACLLRAPSRLHRLDRAASMLDPGIAGVTVLHLPHQDSTPEGRPLIRESVGVVADSQWLAIKAVRALRPVWVRDAADTTAKLDLPALEQAFINGAAVPVAPLSTRDPAPLPPEGELAHFAQTYFTPSAPHWCMEPLNCTAILRADGAELWVGSQSPNGIRGVAAQQFGVSEESILVHCHASGGGFGRRYYSDYPIEALEVSRRSGGAPIKLLWTREQDLESDLFHHACAARLEATLHEDTLVALDYRSAATDRPGTPWIGYAVPNLSVGGHDLTAVSSVRHGAWRGVGTSSFCFPVERFVDDLARHLRRDPLEFRLSLLPAGAEHDVGHNAFKLSGDRLRGVLLRLREHLAGWPALISGDGIVRSRGIAILPYVHCNSYVAVAVEIAIEGETISVDRVAIAADCGLVVNPDRVRAQLEGGVLWALGWTFGGPFPLRDGVAEPGPALMTDYLARFGHTPAIEIALVDSGYSEPCGVGELVNPVIPPAIANALAAVTGQPVTKLPLPYRIAPSRRAATRTEGARA